MESLMSTPVGVYELLIGKLVPYYFLGMASMTLCVIIAVFLYHVPFRGSYLVLVVVTTVFLFGALGLGLLISSFARNQFVASQIAIVASFLPAFILSGFIFEISSMPAPIRLFTYLLPARYFVSCMQTLFLVGNIWSLIIFNCLMMLAVGMIFSTITILKSVKRLD
jgi:ABC-2 type transport system permease protein